MADIKSATHCYRRASHYAALYDDEYYDCKQWLGPGRTQCEGEHMPYLQTARNFTLLGHVFSTHGKHQSRARDILGSVEQCLKVSPVLPKDGCLSETDHAFLSSVPTNIMGHASPL